MQVTAPCNDIQVTGDTDLNPHFKYTQRNGQQQMTSKAGSVTTTPLPTPNLTLVQGHPETCMEICDSARLSSAAPFAISLCRRPQESIHRQLTPQVAHVVTGWVGWQMEAAHIYWLEQKHCRTTDQCKSACSMPRAPAVATGHAFAGNEHDVFDRWQQVPAVGS